MCNVGPLIQIPYLDLLDFNGGIISWMWRNLQDTYELVYGIYFETFLVLFEI